MGSNYIPSLPAVRIRFLLAGDEWSERDIQSVKLSYFISRIALRWYCLLQKWMCPQCWTTSNSGTRDLRWLVHGIDFVIKLSYSVYISYCVIITWYRYMGILTMCPIPICDGTGPGEHAVKAIARCILCIRLWVKGCYFSLHNWIHIISPSLQQSYWDKGVDTSSGGWSPPPRFLEVILSILRAS